VQSPPAPPQEIKTPQVGEVVDPSLAPTSPQDVDVLADDPEAEASPAVVVTPTEKPEAPSAAVPDSVPQVTPDPAPTVAVPELRPVPSPKPDTPIFPKLPDIATEAPAKAPPPIESPESMLLKSAHDQIEKGNLIRADDYFKLLQSSNDSYLPVYSDRARLFEKRGMLKEAINQWSQLKEKSSENSIWSTLAQKEQHRLTQRVQALEASTSIQSHSVTSVPNTVAASNETITKDPAPTQQLLEIISAEAPQMGSGDNYDYMRILSVELKALPVGQTVYGKDILVRIQFYDQDTLTRRIYPSEIYVPKTTFTLSGVLAPGKAYSITCPYTVPINYREKQFSQSKRKLTYYGFTVEVIYQGHPQHKKSKPLSLSSRIK
jgi:hypothetical protein